MRCWCLNGGEETHQRLGFENCRVLVQGIRRHHVQPVDLLYKNNQNVRPRRGVGLGERTRTRGCLVMRLVG